MFEIIFGEQTGGRGQENIVRENALIPPGPVVLPLFISGLSPLTKDAGTGTAKLVF